MLVRGRSAVGKARNDRMRKSLQQPFADDAGAGADCLSRRPRPDISETVSARCAKTWTAIASRRRRTSPDAPCRGRFAPVQRRAPPRWISQPPPPRRPCFSERRTHAPRQLPLRRRQADASVHARGGDVLQLLAVPPHRRALGLLLVRHGPHRRPPREHDRLRPGRQDAAHDSLPDLRLCHALGADRCRAGRQARRPPGQLRSRAHRGRQGAQVRWRQQLEIL